MDTRKKFNEDDFTHYYKKDNILDLRTKFNEDEYNYDLLRPRYCDQMFEDIMEYSKLNQSSHLVEVGIGTGQATEPFLKQGCSVTAIELGDKLAAYCKKKYSSYEKFRIRNIAFESFKSNLNSIDLLYSATAFHWIPSEFGYSHAYNMIKSGGAIALFWNRPSLGKATDDFFIAIQKVYKEYGFPPLPNESEITEKYKRRKENLINNGFVDVDFRLYNSTRTLNAEEYISLLNTYSDHRSLSSEIKTGLENKIYDTINHFGGIVTIYDTIDLYLGRKPEKIT